MIVIRNKADVKIEYPIETLSSKDKVIFFDIETTGFSRKYCNIYLIGCMYYAGEQLMYTQWLAKNFNDEANVLMAFNKFIKDFDTIIHFNGNSFDIPFVKERGEKYMLDFNFEKYKQIDIYKSVNSINHILKMENQKQKTFEKLLNIERTDPFSGGDLIEVFKQYVESKDERLLFPLLLHNKEDVFNMGYLLSLLAFNDLFNYKYNIKKYDFYDYTDSNENPQKDLCVNFVLDNPLPTNISYNISGISLIIKENVGELTVNVLNGTYKYFYSNYKDYYYLTTEDVAVHKSVAHYVDTKYRKQATASTCYEKHTGEFLPVKDSTDFKYLFKEEYKDKYQFIKADSINDETIKVYVNSIIDFIKVKPK